MPADNAIELLFHGIADASSTPEVRLWNHPLQRPLSRQPADQSAMESRSNQDFISSDVQARKETLLAWWGKIWYLHYHQGIWNVKRLIDEIRKCCSYIVGYNFDSFAFHPLSLSWYNHVDKFYTFDYADAQKYNLDVVELYSAISGINVLTNKNRNMTYR